MIYIKGVSVDGVKIQGQWTSGGHGRMIPNDIGKFQELDGVKLDGFLAWHFVCSRGHRYCFYVVVVVVVLLCCFLFVVFCCLFGGVGCCRGRPDENQKPY